MDEIKKAFINELEVERNAFKVASQKTDKYTKHGEGVSAGLDIAAIALENRIKELREE